VIIHDLKQGSPEWLAVRGGKFTASNFGKLMMAKSTKGYNDLINTVVFERISGTIPEQFQNEWMERGNALESEAIEAYELRTFNSVDRIGFIEMDEWVGCSPDGLVEDEGMVQVKCPKYTTLVDYLLSDEIPSEYLYQMQGEMMVTGRKWNDFWAYHPNFVPMLRRVERDEETIAKIRERLSESIKEVNKRIKQLTKR